MTKGKCALLMMLLLGGSSVAMADGPWGPSGPDGNTYRVQVRTDDGHRFYDCFKFDRRSPGSLEVASLYQPLKYAHDDLNRDPKDWQATTVIDHSHFGIAFHGTVKSGGRLLIGDAVNEYGSTFTFQGVKVRYCRIEHDHHDPLSPEETWRAGPHRR